MPHRIIWSWYTGRWWVGCYGWYSEEGTGWGRRLPRPLLAVPHVTAHPSTASVPIKSTVFYCVLKGLTLLPPAYFVLTVRRRHGSYKSSVMQSQQQQLSARRRRQSPLHRSFIARLQRRRANITASMTCVAYERHDQEAVFDGCTGWAQNWGNFDCSYL